MARPVAFTRQVLALQVAFRALSPVPACSTPARYHAPSGAFVLTLPPHTATVSTRTPPRSAPPTHHAPCRNLAIGILRRSGQPNIAKALRRNARDTRPLALLRPARWLVDRELSNQYGQRCGHAQSRPIRSSLTRNRCDEETGRYDPDHVVQQRAEAVRRAVDALFAVVTDRNGLTTGSSA